MAETPPPPPPNGAEPRGPALPKRFYANAAVAGGEGGFVLTLDGRPARTPGRVPLALPTAGLAEAVAAEWAAQDGVIDPATMHLTKLANSAIDGVARDIDGVLDDVVRYAGSDLVVYRAGHPERLVAMQAAAWDPILDWAREAFGARFVLSEGVMFVEQPETSILKVRQAAGFDRSPFRLAALHVMTSLTGSALIALAQAMGRLSAEEAWAAAHVDERFQESQWGEDAEAASRRARREAEFRAASRFYALSSRA